jgi:hypothetical protein
MVGACVSDLVTVKLVFAVEVLPALSCAVREYVVDVDPQL